VSKQFSNTLDSMGLIAIPLKSSIFKFGDYILYQERTRETTRTAQRYKRSRS